MPRRDHSYRFPSRQRHRNPYIRPYIGLYIPYIYPPIPETVENITLPRQFARLFEPDPIRFLLPDGHQRATRPAYRTALGKSYWVGLSSRATTNWRGQFSALTTTLQLPQARRYRSLPSCASAGRPTPTEARTRRTNTRHGTAASRCTRTHVRRQLHSRNALVRRERSAPPRRPPPASLSLRHDRHRQDRTAYRASCAPISQPARASASSIPTATRASRSPPRRRASARTTSSISTHPTQPTLSRTIPLRASRRPTARQARRTSSRPSRTSGRTAGGRGSTTFFRTRCACCSTARIKA